MCSLGISCSYWGTRPSLVMPPVVTASSDRLIRGVQKPCRKPTAPPSAQAESQLRVKHLQSRSWWSPNQNNGRVIAVLTLMARVNYAASQFVADTDPPRLLRRVAGFTIATRHDIHSAMRTLAVTMHPDDIFRPPTRRALRLQNRVCAYRWFTIWMICVSLISHSATLPHPFS